MLNGRLGSNGYLRCLFHCFRGYRRGQHFPLHEMFQEERSEQENKGANDVQKDVIRHQQWPEYSAS